MLSSYVGLGLSSGLRHCFWIIVLFFSVMYFVLIREARELSH